MRLGQVTSWSPLTELNLLLYNKRNKKMIKWSALGYGIVVFDDVFLLLQDIEKKFKSILGCGMTSWFHCFHCIISNDKSKRWSVPVCGMIVWNEFCVFCYKIHVFSGRLLQVLWKYVYRMFKGYKAGHFFEKKPTESTNGVNNLKIVIWLKIKAARFLEKNMIILQGPKFCSF